MFLLMEKENYAEAEQYLLLALSQAKKLFGNLSDEAAYLMLDLAQLYYQEHDYTRAEEYRQQGSEILRALSDQVTLN